MNPQANEQPTGMPSWYDPFQEIRTMPKGWDLSSILQPRRPAPQPGGNSSDQDQNASTKPDLENLP